MKINGNLKKYSVFASIAGVFLAISTIIIAVNLFNPLEIPIEIIDIDKPSLIDGTASTQVIKKDITTEFGVYNPQTLTYSPEIKPTIIQPKLANVDLQGLEISDEIQSQLEQYGFALVDEGYKDIYELYDLNDGASDLVIPKFVTTDLALHAYHVIYDISLRVLEGVHFFNDFELMLQTLRSDQLALNSSVSEETIQDAITKNVAYLSVMLHLLNNTNDNTAISSAVDELVNLELANINAGQRASSAIFGYDEDFTQYTVRGHYTRNEILGNFFQAMMYAGRMGFLLQSSSGDTETSIKQTRMALLLISSFNTTINNGTSSETVWDLWDRIYQPTAFYVGTSDDLTPLEYFEIMQTINDKLNTNQLGNNSFILDFINEAKTYRKPQINSMFVTGEFENATQGFRLMGQRFIPDSYIFQQLVANKVSGRPFPSGLDVFSVFGSSQAASHQEAENKTYPEYHSQILKLRSEFGNLTDIDWTQNLYWLWLYSLFPLLRPAINGYPGFMLSDAWTDKVLMTAAASWAELRHDTILFAKQSVILQSGLLNKPKGYIEPYPEVYSRLASLVRLMSNGLEERGLFVGLENFKNKLNDLSVIFDRLTEISIKELENQELIESDINYISNVGDRIVNLAKFDSNDPETGQWVSVTDDRMAIVVDVHTNLNSGQVLEVGTGNPFVIYAIVQDQTGNLRLTRGGTFSYYEFKHPMDDRLSDESWHEILDTNPPELPLWIQDSVPILASVNAILQLLIMKKEF